ncbi:MAG: hypothetical protein AAF845_20695 [Bacteroidota bacterium]
MRRFALPFAAALVFSACAEPEPPAVPPEGWTAVSETEWHAPGVDPEVAFRDLSTIEAMGVVQEGESEFVRWFQERMTDLYRTHPERVDSVFTAEFLPLVRQGLPDSEDYGPAAEAFVNQVKRDFFQRYNAARYDPVDTPLAIPADLTEVSGQAVMQVYVNEAKEPVAVKLLEGTDTRLDQIAMRRAIEAEFTDAWVRETAGRSAGKNIDNWVRVTSTFGT